jgi:hypothetical protein
MAYLAQALIRKQAGTTVDGNMSSVVACALAKHATEKVNLREPLKPGIYQGTRRIGEYAHSFKVPFATHRFLVMIPEDPEKFEGKLTDLGNGQKGIVVGAYNKKIGKGRQLRYHRNHGNDMEAVKMLMKLKSQGAGAWGAKIKRVFRNSGDGPDDEISTILEKARAFRQAARKNPITYPSALDNIFARGKNSNTFVASLLTYAGLKNKANRDMPGYDAGADLRFEPEQFGVKQETPA